MTIIESNIKSKVSKTHDPIKHAPIEKQLFDILSEKLQGVTYTLEKKFIYFKYGDITIAGEIKNSVKLKVHSMTKDWFNDFEIEDSGDHDRKLPSVTLNFNKDITKPLDAFIEKVIKLQELKDLARPLFNKLKREEAVLDKAITNYLNDYFGDGLIDVRLWIEPRTFFDGFGLGFHIKPIDAAPADGAYFLLETDGTLDLFWNCSTPRRSSYGNRPENFERVFSRVKFSDGIHGMKHKVEVLENFEKKLKNFDYKKCPDIVRLMEYKIEANKIKEEVDKLC